MNPTSMLAKAMLVVCAGVLSTSSAFCALVTWQLNPDGLNANVGSASRSYTVSGYSITARGYDNVPGTDTPHALFYKQAGPIGGAGEHGLGIVGTATNELQVNSDGTPAQYIQLDLRAILGQSFGSFTGGELSVGSIQSGESFRLFGSNSQGVLGSQLAGTWGSSFDEKFISIPNFGSFQFISIASNSADVLPIAFRANITAVPEMNALFPLVGLVTAVSATHVLRRRSAQRASRG